MAHYTDATGHAPLLPEWAVGFWQCKLRYRTQEVYLPDGTAWTDAWTDEAFEGGQWITADVPLERIPLCLRGGARLPSLAARITRLITPYPLRFVASRRNRR
jgi:alpha-glucosidase (family GH31 glycosyl hydrolase)